MTRYASRLASSALLTVGICLLVTSGAKSADDDEKKQIAAAQKDVIELAKAIEKGEAGAAQAKAIRKKYDDFQIVMTVYKPTAKGGIGFPPKAAGDGIELKVINLGKKVMAPMDLTAHKEKLIRLGYINLAMAEIAHQYAPTKTKNGKGAKEWKEYTEDLRKSSKDFIEAAKKGQGAKLKAAANNITTSCNTCHSDFRD